MNLAQYQTLSIRDARSYSGYSSLFYHPIFDAAPIMSLEDRFADFCARLSAKRTAA